MDLLLPQWFTLLKGWALDGSISLAAQESFQLDGEPEPLKELISQWAAGDVAALPPVELLPAEAMAGAAGAYAIQSGTIYLNADWLLGASPAQVQAVLSEELGHHLDGLLNTSDTPGDEGELFAALLHGNGMVSAEQRRRLLTQNDHGSVLLNGELLAVEQASVVSTPIPVATPGRTRGEYRNWFAFAALKADGSVVTWGDPLLGGDSSAVAGQLSSGVSQIFSSSGAFAALKTDGSVVSWGDHNRGGDSSSDYTSVIGGVTGQLSSGVTQIFSNPYAFAALKADSSVVIWGHPSFGGSSSVVDSQLSSGVAQIFSSGQSFAALKDDGSVVTWGDRINGGNSSAVASRLSSGVTRIFSSEYAFAALKEDGSVVTWGGGGNSGAVAAQLSSGVTQIFSTDSDFAALKADGSVITWGYPTSGGDSSGVASQLSSGVIQIFSTGRAFAALKADGSVVTWGDSLLGGISKGVASRLSSGVTKIFSNVGAFAALKTDGSVVTWGDPSSGGDSSAVAGQLSSGVNQIFSTGRAFAALMADGSVVTWGHSSNGGDSSGVAGQLTNVMAFANPFTDDRLIIDSLPSITLAASLIPMAEDGAGNLIYTFSRTGSLISELTVTYTVAGTATAGSDYTGIDPAAITKSVVFAPGSDTAVVEIDPIADTVGELDETVALTLLPASGYTIGTTEAVVGTINNDDRPQITAITTTGTKLELQFSDALVTTGLLASRFAATVAGAARSISSWAPVAGDPTRLILTLSGAAPTSSQAIALRYTDLTAADDLTGVVQDTAGNDMATIAAPGRNADTFSSAASVTTLASSYTNLILTGTATAGTGNAAANRLTVNQATAIANVLTGGDGTDTMDGSNGSDIYLIANAAHHTAAEISDGGSSGRDELRFAATTAGQTLTVFAGDTGLEAVTIGTGTAAAAVTTATTALSINAAAAPNGLSITGNGGANTLIGTAFLDILTGGVGLDAMDGGDGADLY
ncbi:MAG: hypothetical protein ACK5E6_03280, partial [Cyanobacteriota bacterium]